MGWRPRRRGTTWPCTWRSAAPLIRPTRAAVDCEPVRGPRCRRTRRAARNAASRASTPARCAPVSRANRPTMNAATASGAARPPARRASGTAGDRTSGRRTARRVRPGAPDRARSGRIDHHGAAIATRIEREARCTAFARARWYLAPPESAAPAGGAPARQGGDAGAHPPCCECGQPTLPAPSGLCVPCELRRLGVRR